MAVHPDIPLSDIIRIDDPENYKLHFAKWDGLAQPLDDYLRDWDWCAGWQRYWPGRNDFNLPRVFSLMSFYPEPDVWLFGGIWRIVERRPDAYEVALDDRAAAFIGRLKVRYRYKDRATRPFLGKHYDRMVVSELLREPYTGRRFPGFQNLVVSFAELEVIVAAARPDWKETLELAKGVYLITDTSSGRGYRLADEFVRYHAFATGQRGSSSSAVIDDLLVQKALMRLRGGEAQRDMLSRLGGLLGRCGMSFAQTECQLTA